MERLELFCHWGLLFYRMVIILGEIVTISLPWNIIFETPLPGGHSFSLFTFSYFSCMRHLPSNLTQSFYFENIFIYSYRRGKLIHFITKAYVLIYVLKYVQLQKIGDGDWVNFYFIFKGMQREEMSFIFTGVTPSSVGNFPSRK